MRFFVTCFLVLFIFTSTSAQYKNDNVKFTTVYLEDLCNTLQKNSGYILLDVRSSGEANDTSSSYKSGNIGHFKSAINIDIRELPKRINELNAYKQTPVFVYCSHSQRSRRVSAMLADSGFAKVFNVNGGLSGNYLYTNDLYNCPQITVERNLPYSIVSALEIYNNPVKKKYLILDIRNDSVINGTSSDRHRVALGKFANAVNIPFSDLGNRLNSLGKGKPVLLVDDYGDKSPEAARLLVNNGFKNVSILFDGMDAATEMKAFSNEKSFAKWQPTATYHLITSDEFDILMKKNEAMVVVDVRMKEQFNNTAKDTWRRIGNIHGAVNIPYDTLKATPSLLKPLKDLPIIVYGFSDNDEVFESADLLSRQGYKDVSVLLGGIFNLRWKAANLKGKSHLKNWVENIPTENL